MKTAALSKFRFLQYRVVSFEFHCHDTEQIKEHAPWNYSLNLVRKISERLARDNEDTAGILVPVELTVQVEWNPSLGPFSAKATLRGIFEHDSTMPDKDAERMCKYHAPALLYAQLRPLFRIHASEAGFPSFTLPLINISETLKEQDDSSGS